MNPIIGHKKILTFFEQIIAHDSLAHAYCFIGPHQVGKKAVAREIVGKLYGKTRDKLETVADFLEIGQEKDEKTAKTKKGISIEQIHALTNFLSQSPFLGGYKIAIIDTAEKLNTASANALLKTLEEPRGKTILFLLADNEAALPATILSRCQLIYFHPVHRNDMVESLNSGDTHDVFSEEMIDDARGLPGLLMNWINEPEQYAAYVEEKNRFVSLRGQPFYAKLQMIDDLFGDKTDHIAARDHLLEVLSIWQFALRQEINNSEKSGIVSVYDTIEQVKRQLQQNIHPRLLVEQILLVV